MKQHFPHDPFFLQWHITDNCNLRCAHCYNTDYTKATVSFAKLFFVLEEYALLLKHLQKKGRVQFAGGEPLLSPHFFQLVAEARKKDMAVRILSNGTLINHETAEKIASAGCYIVQISIEGDKDTHDAIRGERSFQQALSGAKALNQRGLELTFAMTLTKKNCKKIKYLFKLADKYANRIGFHRLVPIGTGENMQSEMLTPKELWNAFKQIDRLKKKYKRLAIPQRDPLWQCYHQNLQEHNISGCSAGFNGLCIGSNGDVYPCRRLPVKIGNVFEESLVKLFETSEVMQQLRARDKREGGCGACRYNWVCGGCPGIGYALSGNLMAEDPQCFKSIL